MYVKETHLVIVPMEAGSMLQLFESSELWTCGKASIASATKDEDGRCEQEVEDGGRTYM
jgi:hypothetical protein